MMGVKIFLALFKFRFRLVARFKLKLKLKLMLMMIVEEGRKKNLLAVQVGAIVCYSKVVVLA
jgi:hypothetical protein